MMVVRMKKGSGAGCSEFLAAARIQVRQELPGALSPAPFCHSDVGVTSWTLQHHTRQKIRIFFALYPESVDSTFLIATFIHFWSKGEREKDVQVVDSIVSVAACAIPDGTAAVTDEK